MPTGHREDWGTGNKSRDVTVYQAPAFRPWMKAYACWVAIFDQGSMPGRDERLKMARSLASGRMSRPGLRYLESRQDFKELVNELAQDETIRARAKMGVFYDDAVYFHNSAAKKLHDSKDLRDVAQVSKFTTPYLDRIMPKTEEQQQQATVIQVNIGDPAAQRSVEAMDAETGEAIEVSAVEIKEDKDDPDA